MANLFKNPIFIGGLLLRLALLAILLPYAPQEWYLPFLQNSIDSFSIDPWGSFIAQGGSSLAFPYGYAMWLVFMPLSILCKVFAINPYWGYGLTLLLVDVGLLMTLRKLMPMSEKRLLLAYWSSSIVLFSTYWLGFNDLIPVLFLCLALLLAFQLNFLASGILCGVAISAKLSMVLVVPFFLVYLFRNSTHRRFVPSYLIGLFTAFLFLGVPFLLSNQAVQMLAHNPEMGTVYYMGVPFGKTLTLYLMPMVYVLSVYLLWWLKRISFWLFFSMLGIGFFWVLLLSPASPGWFVWVIPLLVYYQKESRKTEFVLVGCFSALYVIINLLVATHQPLVFGESFAHSTIVRINALLGNRGHGLLHTLLITFGVILVLRIWQKIISRNDYYRLSRQPLVIGIAGDSSSGKDTLVNSLVGLFGSHSVTTVSGDDYHLWDRHRPIWQVMTHLNPKANDLEQLALDVMSLADGKAIQQRLYDHSDGKKSNQMHQLQSKSCIIVSGLHALYLPMLRECYDLSIFLDIDEELRQYFKIVRDVHHRGQSIEKVRASLAMRENDSQNFVRPQRAHADLVLSLQPIHPQQLEDKLEQNQPLRYKLSVRARHGINDLPLVRVLVGLCGLHVDLDIIGESSEIALVIEGEASAEDIAFSARELMPDLLEFLDIEPRWENGVTGVMQLLVLSHVHQVLKKRLK